MPNHPSWLERAPDILNTLESETAPPILDRKAIETLFGVRRRQAIALLHRFDGYQVGRTFVAPRQAVIDFLAPLAAGEPLARAGAQRRRVEEFLGEARQSLTLLRIPLPAAKLSEITFAGLPSGIQLLPGQLSIHFAGATELLEKLFALSQALANDFEALESALAGASPELTR